MKNTTLRGLFAASLLLVSSNVFAQSAPVTDDAQASATVVQKITVVKGEDLKFTTVASGVNKKVSTTNQVTFPGSGQGIVEGNEKAANFAITKAALIPVLVTVTGLEDLQDLSQTGDNATVNMATSYDLDAVVALASQTANMEFGAEGSTRSIQINGDNQALNSATEFFVRIGGTVSPTAAQNPGLYTRTITLTATYN